MMFLTLMPQKNVVTTFYRIIVCGIIEWKCVICSYDFLQCKNSKQ